MGDGTGRADDALQESDLLTAAELDELAEGFLWADQFSWPVPRAWITDGTVALQRQARSRGIPVHLERPVAPLRMTP